MLIEFSCENFASIKERMTFSLLAGNGSENPDNLISDESLPLSNGKLLKTSVFYGANASGKSNFIKAIDCLRNLVLRSHSNQRNNKLNTPKFALTPFKLDLKLINEPTSFEIIFIKDNIKYSYGVTLDKDKVHREYLYYWPKGVKSKTEIFTRENGKINFPKKARKNTKAGMKQQIYQEETLPNILFLSMATKLSHKQITNVFDWFDNDLNVFVETRGSLSFTADYIADDAKKAKVLKYLSFADINIVDIDVKNEIYTSDNVPDHMKKFVEFVQSLEDSEDEDNIKEIKFGITDIKFVHTGKDEQGNDEKISLDFKTEESEGTKQFFGLLGPVIDVLEKGKTLFVDELDLRLHPNLTTALIKIFHNPEINKNNAQLIFSTHNVNLLDLTLFRRDQIWFADKDKKYGATEIYSLDDFSSVRKDINLLKGYKEGRYGAIPFVNLSKILDNSNAD